RRTTCAERAVPERSGAAAGCRATRPAPALLQRNAPSPADVTSARHQADVTLSARLDVTSATCPRARRDDAMTTTLAVLQPCVASPRGERRTQRAVRGDDQRDG